MKNKSYGDEFSCRDCGANTGDLNEFYVLHQEVWRQAVPDGKGMLCIGCLEKRLGRTLTPADFLHATPGDPKSDRLINRLGPLVCELREIRIPPERQWEDNDSIVFMANVYWNGKKIGIASDKSGRGGCIDFFPTKPYETNRAEFAKMSDHIRTFPAEKSTQPEIAKSFPDGLAMDFELWAGQIVAEFYNNRLEQRERKRWLAKITRASKKETWFRVSGDAQGTWRTIQAPYSIDVAVKIRAKYSGQTIVIAKEIGFEKASKL